ncbi:MAG: T9SS type A sorting domain-containing protein [Sphingobacteriaceae bacterium]|nr:T9SS type A sorting domain-containing protein [Sphingobacteriaceae bacterium]
MAQTSQPHIWDNVDIGGGGFVSAIITSKKDPTLMYARTDVGGAYRYDRANSRWIPLTDWASDTQQGILGIESLATDPSDAKVVYMAAGISYYDAKSYILRSFDYGATFSIVDVSAKMKFHGNKKGRQNGEKLAVDPNKNGIVFIGSPTTGLWKSTDYGFNWNPAGNISSSVTTTPNGNGISFVILDKSSGVAGTATPRMFVGISRAGSNNNFYRSNDGGNTFTAIDNTALPDNMMPQRAVFSGNGFIYITYANGCGPANNPDIPSESMDQGQLWKYNIATGAWTNITPLSSANRLTHPMGGISVDPANPNRIVASSINTYQAQGNAWGDHFYLSTDGGTNWVDVVARGYAKDPNGVTWVSNSSIHWCGSIEFDPSNTNRVWVTSGNGVWVNDNITLTTGTWKFLVKGLEETVSTNLVSIPGGPVISTIGDYDGFRHTDVYQYAPIHNPRMGTTTGLAYGVTNKNKVVRVGKAIYYSNDMGVTWTKSAVINGAKGEGKIAVSADGNTILHSPKESSTTYRSTNNGTSWTTVTGLSFGDARPVSDGLTNGKFYAYNPGTGALMVSTNGGASFAASAVNPGAGGSKVICTVPGRDGDVWIPLMGGGLKYTENSGASFTTVSKVTWCRSVGIGKTATGATYETLYIWGTVNGVVGLHRSTDKGLNWIRVNDDDHEYAGPGNGSYVVGDMNVFGRVYMSTAGRGIVFATQQTCTPTAITPHLQINGGAWTQTGTATLAAGGTVKFGPQPSTSTTWEWRGPNEFKATGREVTITNVQAATAGTYTATCTNSSGCKSSYMFKIILSGTTAAISGEPDLTLAASSQIGENDNRVLQAYPNPVDDKVTISVPENLVGGVFNLISSSGSMVYAGNVSQITTVLDLGSLSSGLYILTVKSNGTSSSVKILKK